jgi:putative hydrolase of the HAD superfamily
MIRNIVFDLGGVLIDLDPVGCSKAFSNLGFNMAEDPVKRFHGEDIFKLYETGSISTNEFLNKIAEASAKGVTHEQLSSAWNSMLGPWRISSLDFLKTLKQQYRLYLLSNTNELHEISFKRKLLEAGLPTIDTMFIKPYFSHKIHLRKPGREIFEYVVNNAGILPEDTLFIDDTALNLPNAAQVGIKTFLLQRGYFIENLDYQNAGKNQG